MSKAEEIERLEELRRSGTLTDEEFETAKAEVLDGRPAAGDGLGLGGTIDKIVTDENQWAMMIHFSQLLGYIVPVLGLVVPIVLWQVKKDTSRSIDQHGRVVTNWIITEVIFLFISVAASFILIGVPMLMALAVVMIVFPIMGGIKANKGELWPYPMSFVFFPLELADEPPSADVASDEPGGEAYQDEQQDGDRAD